MGNKLYDVKVFDLCCKKWSLWSKFTSSKKLLWFEQTLWRNIFNLSCKKIESMKQIHLFNKGFVIFLKGATFSYFIGTRIWNYKPLAIQIRFLLFWRIFFLLGSNFIKYVLKRMRGHTYLGSTPRIKNIQKVILLF